MHICMDFPSIHSNFEAHKFSDNNFEGKIHELAIEKIPSEQPEIYSFSKVLNIFQNQEYNKIHECVVQLRDQNGRTLFQALIHEAPLEKIRAFEMNYPNTPILQKLVPNLVIL